MSRNEVTQELTVDTDYGVISAKVWNTQKEGCKKIIATHGWMDNAGSFDKLIPLLNHPNGIYVLAIDLPGHGKSSQLPKGVPYNDLCFIASMRLLVRRLGWNQRSHSNEDGDDADKSKETKDKYILIGHSLGAGQSLFYASMFPEDVEQLILLDFMKSQTLSTRELLQQLSRSIDKLQQSVRTTIGTKRQDQSDGIERKLVTSQDLALSAIIQAHEMNGYLSRDDALCLLKRSSLPGPPNRANSFYLVRDTRMPYLLNYRDHVEPNIHYSLGFDCHGLIILAKRGLFGQRKKIDHFTNNADCVVKNMKERCKTFNLIWLNSSDHYLHMNDSGVIAEIINQSLLEPGNIEPV